MRSREVRLTARSVFSGIAASEHLDDERAVPPRSICELICRGPERFADRPTVMLLLSNDAAHWRAFNSCGLLDQVNWATNAFCQLALAADKSVAPLGRADRSDHAQGSGANPRDPMQAGRRGLSR